MRGRAVPAAERSAEGCRRTSAARLRLRPSTFAPILISFSRRLVSDVRGNSYFTGRLLRHHRDSEILTIEAGFTAELIVYSRGIIEAVSIWNCRALQSPNEPVRTQWRRSLIA